MKKNSKTFFWCRTDLFFLSVCISPCMPLSVYCSTSFFSALVQIQDFSSGFWDGTKLACWMKGETPWRFFPKLSIYLRATNTSQSFRITILPQVNINTGESHSLQIHHQPNRHKHLSVLILLSPCSCTSSQSQTWTAL